MIFLWLLAWNALQEFPDRAPYEQWLKSSWYHLQITLIVTSNPLPKIVLPHHIHAPLIIEQMHSRSPKNSPDIPNLLLFLPRIEASKSLVMHDCYSYFFYCSLHYLPSYSTRHVPEKHSRSWAAIDTYSTS